MTPTIGTRWRHKTAGGTFALVGIDGEIYTLKRLTIGPAHLAELSAEANATAEWPYLPETCLRELVKATIALPITVDLSWFELNGEMIK